MLPLKISLDVQNRGVEDETTIISFKTIPVGLQHRRAVYFKTNLHVFLLVAKCSLNIIFGFISFLH